MTVGHGHRVLIVDDNATGARLASFLLESDDFEVRIAASGAEALATVARWRPDIALVDLQMPGMSGLELTRSLRADEATAGIKIVAVSAYVRMEDRERAAEAGCDGFVAKPIDTREFASQVAAYLEPPAHQ